jgi:hypothetical protein
MRSPVLCLATQVAAAPFRIAPESDERLHSLLQAKNVTLTISDEPGFDISVGVRSGDVLITESALELLWASAHAHFVFYQEYAAANNAGHTQYALGSSSRARSAMELLKWALGKATGTHTDPWPEEAVRPVEDPHHLSDGHVANELFLCAVAWTLHHEIAHVAMQHSAGVAAVNLAQEKEADLEATKHILFTAPEEPQRQKRALGIISAILALQYLDSPQNYSGNIPRTHPRAFERLAYCLDVHPWEPDCLVHAFALVLMQIFMSESGVTCELEGDSLSSVLYGFFINLSRQ